MGSKCSNYWKNEYLKQLSFFIFFWGNISSPRPSAVQLHVFCKNFIIYMTIFKSSAWRGGQANRPLESQQSKLHTNSFAGMVGDKHACWEKRTERERAREIGIVVIYINILPMMSEGTNPLPNLPVGFFALKSWP